VLISIIIPAYNAAKTVKSCLVAVQNQQLPPHIKCEIIVVNDASNDKTADIVAAIGATIINHEKKRGAAAARNSGIAVAQGEIILFTDADCVPEANWVTEMLRPFTDPTVSGCKGIYASKQTKLVARFVQIEYEDKYDLLRKQPSIDFIDTYSAGYRTDILKSCGGFDEHIYYVEDQELSFRLAAQGHKMVFQETAVVTHHHSHTLWHYFRKKVMIGYWKAQIMRRFPERAIKDSHTPQVLKLQMGLVALILASFVIIPFLPYAFIISLFLIFSFFLSTIPYLKKAWRKDRQVCLASPFLLFVRALALGIGYAWGIARPQPN
jgi:glycosyltransferase involved in cell wall biosynthesis